MRPSRQQAGEPRRLAAGRESPPATSCVGRRSANAVAGSLAEGFVRSARRASTHTAKTRKRQGRDPRGSSSPIREARSVGVVGWPGGRGPKGSAAAFLAEETLWLTEGQNRPAPAGVCPVVSPGAPTPPPMMQPTSRQVSVPAASPVRRRSPGGYARKFQKRLPSSPTRGTLLRLSSFQGRLGFHVS